MAKRGKVPRPRRLLRVIWIRRRNGEASPQVPEEPREQELTMERHILAVAGGLRSQCVRARKHEQLLADDAHDISIFLQIGPDAGGLARRESQSLTGDPGIGDPLNTPMEAVEAAGVCQPTAASDRHAGCLRAPIDPATMAMASFANIVLYARICKDITTAAMSMPAGVEGRVILPPNVALGRRSYVRSSSPSGAQADDLGGGGAGPPHYLEFGFAGLGPEPGILGTDLGSPDWTAGEHHGDPKQLGTINARRSTATTASTPNTASNSLSLATSASSNSVDNDLVVKRLCSQGFAFHAAIACVLGEDMGAARDRRLAEGSIAVKNLGLRQTISQGYLPYSRAQ
ncbi:hypothetical protein G7046_g6135 [Stylonectria norvegica]|nr:hypothetical protein G7046_g6135 [Stylonectria norvegica]